MNHCSEKVNLRSSNKDILKEKRVNLVVNMGNVNAHIYIFVYVSVG